MAGRGGQKLREFRQHVTSVRHWLKEIEYEGLIMCEVYSGFFGNCQVILPTINTIMLNIDDSDDKIKWLVINVAKLEEEQRHMLAEEEKKKADMESVQRRKAANEADAPHGGGGGGGAESNGGGDHVSTLSINTSLSVHTNNDDGDGGLSESVLNSPISSKMKSAWDKITIPKLEKYSGYDHPNPLWLLIKDGQIVYELHAANAPKMTKMVQAVLANTPLSEKELSDMDFHPDPAAAQRRKEKRPTKKQKEEAARAEALAKKRKARMQKPEVVRAPEYIVQVRIADIHRPPPSTEPLPPLSPSQAAIAAAAAAAAAAAVAAAGGDGTRHPMLVLYTKDAAADDFTYYGQCERIFNDYNPAYNRSFAFPLADVQPLFEQNLDVECKFVLYDADSDHVSKDVHPPILGDAYLSLRALVDAAGPGEGGHTEVKLKKHMAHPHPPLMELKSARDKKAAAAAAAGIVLPEEKHHEEDCGTLQLTTKLRSSEGAVTSYRLRIAARNLPSLTKDGLDASGQEAFGVAEFQPPLTDEEGLDIDPALIDASSRREYILEVTQSDANATRASSQGLTEIVAGTSDPSFNQELLVQHATKDDRVLSFLLYDALGLDAIVDQAAARKAEKLAAGEGAHGVLPGIGLDGVVHSVQLKKHLIGYASIGFTAFLTQRRQFGNHISLPLVDATGASLLAGAAPGEMASLFIQADELAADGSVEPYDQEELDEIAAMELAAATVVMSPRAAAAAAALAAQAAAMAAATAAAAAAAENPEASAAATSEPVEASEPSSSEAPAAANNEESKEAIEAAVTGSSSSSRPASRTASRPASRTGTATTAPAAASSSRPASRPVSRPGTASGSAAAAAAAAAAAGASSSRSSVSRTATATGEVATGATSSRPSSRPSTRPGSAVRQPSSASAPAVAASHPLPASPLPSARATGSTTSSRPTSAAAAAGAQSQRQSARDPVVVPAAAEAAAEAAPAAAAEETPAAAEASVEPAEPAAAAAEAPAVAAAAEAAAPAAAAAEPEAETEYEASYEADPVDPELAAEAAAETAPAAAADATLAPAAAAASSSRPVSRPVSATQKLAHNLAVREAEENAEMLAGLAAAHAAATPATVVADSARSVGELSNDPLHGEHGATGHPASPGATPFAPAPETTTSATATSAANE